MSILENYRKQRPGVMPMLRTVLVLAVLLAVLLSGSALMLRRLAIHQPAPAPNAPPVLEQPEPPLPAWTPLPPDAERRLLARVTDQAPLGVRENREAYYYLLNKVRRLSEADLAACVDDSITYADFNRQPEIIRGSVTQTRGSVIRLERTELDQVKAGLSAIYEGQLLTPDGLLYSFVLTDRPPAPFAPGQLSARNSPNALLRGVFLQVIVYENRENPPQLVPSPLLIAKSLTPLAAPPAKRAPVWLLALIGAALIYLIVRVCLMLHRSTGRRARMGDDVPPFDPSA